jgi:hypothetical protein
VHTKVKYHSAALKRCAMARRTGSSIAEAAEVRRLCSCAREDVLSVDRGDVARTLRAEAGVAGEAGRALLELGLTAS